MLKRLCLSALVCISTSALSADCSSELMAQQADMATWVAKAAFREAINQGPLWVEATPEMAFSDYLRAATAIITARNPRGQLPCAVTTPVVTILQQQGQLPDVPTLAQLQSPFELQRPNSEKVALLLHGLTDSPFSYHYLAAHFWQLGYQVRSVLLPGHATAPSDLSQVTLAQWQHTTHYALERAKADFKSVVVVGYSTGAALAIAEVNRAPQQIKAMLLLSPASEAHNKHGWLAKWIAMLPGITWLDADADLDVFKYESFPWQGAALAYQAMQTVTPKQLQNTSDVPIFAALSEVDSTIDSQATLGLLRHWHQLPSRRTSKLDTLVWYGDMQTAQRQLPSDFNFISPPCNSSWCDKIKGMSHIGIIQPVNHSYYGAQATYRSCGGYLSDLTQYQKCKTAPETTFGERTPQHMQDYFPLQRLTFNPSYPQLLENISVFLGDVDKHHAAR
ncbi:alpha/beta hydrolase [Pseudoalteromonas fenneropenaei]|uniref:Alpha/beta hydrolase n=1 Tax=Pseudoalteromonas fenneropenaei TaxID=1737459 RepID=A0ABV7CPC6_9GAMM